MSPATPAADLTLVVLAAGIGSRYGGDKQLDTIGPAGETLSDYAVRDAAGTGVRHAVFVIREELRSAFLAHHRRHAGQLTIEYAVQRLDDLPPPHRAPRGRRKPWGTTHAVLAAQTKIPGPCIVLNADTRINDLYETQAIRAVFGAAAGSVAVSSTKSLTGHCLAGAAGVEAVICCKALVEGCIPPTWHLNDPDPELDLDFVPNAPRRRELRHVMSNSFAFGGHNGVAIFSRYDGA